MNIGSCEIIDLKATTTTSSSRIAYETNDLSTNNSNLNHNTVKISHTISNHEQNGGNVSAAAAKAINGENLEAEINSKGQFSEAEVREVLQEILKILEFVHDHDVMAMMIRTMSSR